jgi:hypothetical protein
VGVWIDDWWFVEHLQLVTRNHNALTNIHTLQITRVHTLFLHWSLLCSGSQQWIFYAFVFTFLAAGDSHNFFRSSLLYSLDTDRIENIASNIFSVACLLLAVGMCLLLRCLAIAASACTTVPYFQLSCHGMFLSPKRLHIHTISVFKFILRINTVREDNLESYT